MKRYRFLIASIILGTILLVIVSGYASQEGIDIPYPHIGNLSWAPDGQKIVFSANPHYEGEPYDIYVVDINSKQMVNLTNTPSVHEDNPSWSPDGLWIAYERYDEGAPSPYIWLMNPDGSVQKQLTYREAYNPVWSPDSNYLIVGGFFSGDFGEGYDLLLLSKEGEESRLLLAAPEDEFPIAWIGSYIYFLKRDSLPGGGLSLEVLWRYDLNSGQRLRMSEPGTYSYHTLSFSPDGSKIVYTPEKGLWISNVDGSGKLLIYEEELHSGPISPIWSPTGQKIAFIKVECTQVEDEERQETYWQPYRENIYLINPDGTGLEQITFFTGFWAKGEKPTVLAKGKGEKREEEKQEVQIARSTQSPVETPKGEKPSNSSQVPLFAGGLSLSALSYAIWKFLKLLS